MDFEKYWCLDGPTAAKCQGLCVSSPKGAQCLCADNSSETDSCVHAQENSTASKCPKGDSDVDLFSSNFLTIVRLDIDCRKIPLNFFIFSQIYILT